MNTREIKENIRIAGTVAAGGSALVEGSCRIEGSLKVNGYLEATALTGFLKGLFPTAEALRRAYPFPRPGWTALVGDTLPADVYRSERGRWVATGMQGCSPELPLQSLEDKLYKDREAWLEAEKKLSERLDSVEDLFVYKGAYVYSYAPEGEREGEPDFECSGYLPVEEGMRIRITAYEHSDVCAPVNYYDKELRHIGNRVTGSNGEKDMTLTRSMMPSEAAFFRVNALAGKGKIEFLNCGRYPMESSRMADLLRDARREDAERMSRQESMLGIVVGWEEVRVNENCYFNLRGVVTGDKISALMPETTKEDGFTAASCSFPTEQRRLLILTGSGNDMVRCWTALDKDMRVVGIAGVSERRFDSTTIELPSSTRHLLLQSYGRRLQAELHYPIGNSSGIQLLRTRTLTPRRGICFDYGSDDIIGKYFKDSEIKRVESIPDAAIAVHEYTAGERIVVTMNTGTPNVRGIVYLDSGNMIIGCEQPLRMSLSETTLTVPETTSRIVFSTYDNVNFPMTVRVERDLLQMLENHLEASETDSGSHEKRTVVLFGDSLFEKADASGRNLGDYLAEETGADIYNCGFGGACLSCRKKTISSGVPADANDAYSRLDVETVVASVCGGDVEAQREAVEYLAARGDDNRSQMGVLERVRSIKPDVVIVLAGTNDYASEVSASGEEIGNAVEHLAAALGRRFPASYLIFATPPPRQENVSDSSTFSDTWKMQGAVSSLPEICARIADEARKRHCEVADLYNCLGWNRYNYAAQCVGSDGTHPVSGYRQMARYLAKYIK